MAAIMIPSHLLGVDNSVLVIVPALVILVALWWRTESSLRRDRISERKARKMWDEFEAKR